VNPTRLLPVPTVTAFLLAGFLAQGCGTKPPPPAAPPPSNALKAELMEPDAPKWMRNGCGAFFAEKKTLICGVGGVAGMTNPSLARTTAEGRARTEIARSLRVRAKAMLKDYQAATQGGPGNKLASEQHIEDTSKQISDVTLSGTRLQDTWVSSKGTLWALMVLDLDAFRSTIKSMNELDEELRRAIVQRADRSFQELDAATEGPLPPLPEEGGAPTP
jgi:hypothetical protein